MPTGVTDPLGRSSSFTYFANSVIDFEESLLAGETLPEGNAQQLTRDARANIIEKRIKAKPGSGLADRVITASYPASCSNRKTCNKPDFLIDARGGRTDYTYDPAHGGILTETGPADANGIRPQKRYSYAQQYAMIRNSAGNLVNTATPVWLLMGISECRTLTSCVGTADETKTTIVYASNNLLATSTTVSSGDNVLAATTSQAYDATGNVLTADGPLPGNADTTRTRYDALRRIIGVVGPDPDGAGTLPTSRDAQYL
ncbi:MAG: hypothetical protein HC872_08440 [Gammaproteobacteria bacterium]|nr:hypothetical protein [Gammaproteobacteria bacterium]